GLGTDVRGCGSPSPRELFTGRGPGGPAARRTRLLELRKTPLTPTLSPCDEAAWGEGVVKVAPLGLCPGYGCEARTADRAHGGCRVEPADLNWSTFRPVRDPHGSRRLRSQNPAVQAAGAGGAR